jgi:hypothetical protein
VSVHRNIFNFLRVLAALMVLFAHQFALLGQQAPAIGGCFEPGAIAMYTFFRLADTLSRKAGCRTRTYAGLWRDAP